MPEATKNPTETPEKKDSSSSTSEVKVGDRVWYKDYSGALVAIVSDVKKGSQSASLSVLTRQGTWLARPDSPRYDKSKFGHPVDGTWAVDRSDLE